MECFITIPFTYWNFISFTSRYIPSNFYSRYHIAWILYFSCLDTFFCLCIWFTLSCFLMINFCTFSCSYQSDISRNLYTKIKWLIFSISIPSQSNISLSFICMLWFCKNISSMFYFCCFIFSIYICDCIIYPFIFYTLKTTYRICCCTRCFPSS